MQHTDAALAVAVSFVRDLDPTDEEIDDIRRSMGFVRPAYRRGARRWNWFWDAEYVAVGPAPWMWAALAVSALGIISVLLIGLCS